MVKNQVSIEKQVASLYFVIRITLSHHLTVSFVDKTFVDDWDSSKLLNHVMEQALVLDNSTLFESLAHYFGH